MFQITIKGSLRVVGTLLIAYGIVAFIAPVLSGAVGLPSGFECPIWLADGCVSDGTVTYCPATPWSRIQVYDSQGEFLRGWNLETYGGSFRIHLDADNHLQVATARLGMLYVFDPEGNLVSSSSYRPRSLSDFDSWKSPVRVLPTPFYLIPLAHPFIGVGLMFIGMVISKMVDRKSKRKRAK